MRFTELVEVLPSLYFAQSLTSSRLGRDLGLETARVKKILVNLAARGIVVKPDVIMARMGLRPVAVLVSKRVERIDRGRAVGIPYLKSLWISPHRGAVFILGLPQDQRIVVDEGEGAEVLYFAFNSRSRPCPDLLEKLRGSLSEVAKTVPREPLPLLEKLASGSTRFDSLDLRILREVRREPWITLRELAQRLRVRERRAEHHVDHAEQLVSGYGIARIGPLFREYGSMRFLLFRCSDASTFTRTALAHPFVLSAMWTRRESLVQVYYPARHGIHFSFLLLDLARSYGCDEVENVEIASDPSLSLITSFPADASEYSKILRTWKPIPVKLSHLLQCVK